jgi:hypothetical protein
MRPHVKPISTHSSRRWHVVRALTLIVFLAATLPTQAASQQGERKYMVGLRSALIVGSMDLSGLDPVFDDLTADGPEGPHMSGFFFLYRVRPYLRVGIETLVSNSDQNAATTMNYQAAGPVVELSYGRSWFVSAGVHAGGVIVNAMVRQDAAPSEGATTGSYFKGNGYFVAPSVDIGYRHRRVEGSVFAKQVNIGGEEDRGGISDFGSTFVGLRLAVGF